MNFLQKIIFPILVLSVACASKISTPKTVENRSLDIADEVMRAEGGQKNWDATRVICWKFFESRTLVWDKWTGDVRIDFLKRDLKIILNLNSMKGRLWLNGAETTQPDSLKKYLERGRRIWINDSYWLVMPFKLKDDGVTLKIVGEGKTEAGRDADILQLTFDNVGVTPENKYHVWVDKKTRLVSQWAFFKKLSDEKPDFINEWSDYQTYGSIKLSGSRGKESGTMTPIRVLDAPPNGAFSDFKN